jgi:DNA-binding HxlR family transcriptional regulator
LGDRWVILILREAFLGITRFEDFMTRLPISRAALSSRLAMMSDAGLLVRDPPDAKRAAYRLTDKGQALEPTYRAIDEWSSEHLFDADEKPRDWRVPD